MSGPAIIRALLVADATLTAAVPATHIEAGVLHQNVALPAIGIVTVSVIERKTIATQSKARITERVQVTMLAADYPTARALVPKVRKACRNKRSSGASTIGGFAGVLVTPEEQGPDLGPGELGIYMQSQDFFVTFDEAT